MALQIHLHKRGREQDKTGRLLFLFTTRAPQACPEEGERRSMNEDASEGLPGS